MLERENSSKKVEKISHRFRLYNHSNTWNISISSGFSEFYWLVLITFVTRCINHS